MGKAGFCPNLTRGTIFWNNVRNRLNIIHFGGILLIKRLILGLVFFTLALFGYLTYTLYWFTDPSEVVLDDILPQVHQAYEKPPLVIAHRGGGGEGPENTIAAIENALSTAVDGLEIDVQRTTDGVLIVYHDWILNRTSNGFGFINDLSYQEVKALDAGSWFGPEFAGEKIPTFREILQLVEPSGKRLLIDFKDPHFYEGIAEEVMIMVDEFKMRDRIWLAAWESEYLEELRLLAPEVPLILNTWWNPQANEYPDFRDINIFSWALTLSPDDILINHDRGKETWVWMANDPAQLKAYLERGVHVIVTDYPTNFMQLYQELFGPSRSVGEQLVMELP